jgi:hypothetical protein
MKRILIIFLFAFVSNLIWENLHSHLYVEYQGMEITQFILMRASFWDAVIITVVLLPFLYINFLKLRSWLIVIVGVVVAVFIELYALETNRWAYNSLMPIIPILQIGLTPTIQLGISGYLTYKFQNYIKKEK